MTYLQQLAAKPLTLTDVLDMWPSLASAGARVFVQVGYTPRAALYTGDSSDHRLHEGDIVVELPSVTDAVNWVPQGTRLAPMGWGRYHAVNRTTKDEC